MIFRKGEVLDKRFLYKGEALELVTKFTYLGIVCTVGGSFNVTFVKLSDQALKAIFKHQRELINFPCITVKHKLNLFDKLVLQILNYRS